MRILFFLVTIFTSQAYAQFGSGLPVDMGRTGQTLNQVDKSQDGIISRNQGYHEEVDKPSPGESYNDEKHREYVRKRKALKSKQDK